MKHVHGVWALLGVLGIGCGGRTLLEGILSPVDGGTSDGPEGLPDGALPNDGGVVRDGSIQPAEGSPPPTSDAIVPPAYDVTISPPFDAVISPPPFDGSTFPTYDASVSPPSYDGSSYGGYDGFGYYYDGYTFPSYDGSAYSSDAVVPPPFEGGLPVACGMTFCPLGDPCCVGFSMGSMTNACVAPGDCDGGVALSCTGSNNCSTPGQACCASFGGGGGSSVCEPYCGPGTFQLCSDGVCPPGQRCVNPGVGIPFCR